MTSYRKAIIDHKEDPVKDDYGVVLAPENDAEAPAVEAEFVKELREANGSRQFTRWKLGDIRLRVAEETPPHPLSPTCSQEGYDDTFLFGTQLIIELTDEGEKTVVPLSEQAYQNLLDIAGMDCPQYSKRMCPVEVIANHFNNIADKGVFRKGIQIHTELGKVRSVNGIRYTDLPPLSLYEQFKDGLKPRFSGALFVEGTLTHEAMTASVVCKEQTEDICGAYNNIVPESVKQMAGGIFHPYITLSTGDTGAKSVSLEAGLVTEGAVKVPFGDPLRVRHLGKAEEAAQKLLNLEDVFTYLCDKAKAMELLSEIPIKSVSVTTKNLAETLGIKNEIVKKDENGLVVVNKEYVQRSLDEYFYFGGDESGTAADVWFLLQMAVNFSRETEAESTCLALNEKIGRLLKKVDKGSDFSGTNYWQRFDAK